MASNEADYARWMSQPLAVFPHELQEWNVNGGIEGNAAIAASIGLPSDQDENMNISSGHNLATVTGTNLRAPSALSDRSDDTITNPNPASASAPAASHLFPRRPDHPSREEIQAGIRECLKIQTRAVQNAKLPFGACLVGPDNTTVILIQGNVDHVNHAECTLARSAAAQFTQEYLWTCTLYSTWEPCAMCASTIYWANIGRIVYAATNDQLLELTGEKNPKNMTMKWHCRDILADSQKDIEIIGPIQGIDRVVMMESDIYWSQVRGKMDGSWHNPADFAWKTSTR